MVSNASEDFPDPETPVMTTIRLCGISSEMFLRLCSRAPRMEMLSSNGNFYFSVLLQHGPAGTAVLPHVNLELLLGPLQFPLLISPHQRVAVQPQKLGPEINVAHQHSAKMSHITDSRVGVGNAEKECHQAHDPDEVANLHRNYEKEQDSAVGKQKPISHNQPEDRPGGSYGWRHHSAWARKKRDDHHAEARSNPTNEVVLQKLLQSPGAFQVGPKPVEGQHVEQDMHEPTVQEHVSDQLPDSQVDHHDRSQLERHEPCRRARDELARNGLEKEDDRVADQQR